MANPLASHLSLPEGHSHQQQWVEEEGGVKGLQGSYAAQENPSDAGYAPDHIQLADVTEVIWEE